MAAEALDKEKLLWSPEQPGRHAAAAASHVHPPAAPQSASPVWFVGAAVVDAADLQRDPEGGGTTRD